MSGINPLPIHIVNVKDKLLQELIEELALDLIDGDDFDALEEYISRFREIYSRDYRHMYSKLYAIVVNIESDEDRECLNNNLEIIRLYSSVYLEDEPELYAHILKLSDHLNLEIQRMSAYMENQDVAQCLEENLSHLQSEYSKLSNDYSKLSKDYSDMSKKIDNHSLETVSVLAIFSAIVMAFTGGLGIIGNALTDLSSVDPGMLMFSILLCGLVLFNTVAFLLNAVTRLVKAEGTFRGIHSGLLCGNHIFLIDVMFLALIGASVVWILLA